MKLKSNILKDDYRILLSFDYTENGNSKLNRNAAQKTTIHQIPRPIWFIYDHQSCLQQEEVHHSYSVVKCCSTVNGENSQFIWTQFSYNWAYWPWPDYQNIQLNMWNYLEIAFLFLLQQMWLANCFVSILFSRSMAILFDAIWIELCIVGYCRRMSPMPLLLFFCSFHFPLFLRSTSLFAQVSNSLSRFATRKRQMWNGIYLPH